MKNKQKVFIVDDSEIERQSLKRLINHESDLEICGEAVDTKEGLNGIKTTKPDIALIDLSLKNANGLDLIRSLKLQGVPTPLLVVSLHDESSFVERVLQEGGRGYLMKQEAAEHVIDAIRQVLGGGIYLSNRMKSRSSRNGRKGQGQ